MKNTVLTCSINYTTSRTYSQKSKQTSYILSSESFCFSHRFTEVYDNYSLLYTRTRMRFYYPDYVVIVNHLGIVRSGTPVQRELYMTEPDFSTNNLTILVPHE